MIESVQIKQKSSLCYLQKINEDGLEQEFNSIDAQRLSGENFVASQTGKG